LGQGKKRTILVPEIKRINQGNRVADLHHKTNIMFNAIVSFNSVREVFIWRATILIVKEQAQTPAFFVRWQYKALSLFLLVAFLDVRKGGWKGNESKSVGKMMENLCVCLTMYHL
jgi:hypothetical protein